MWYNYCGPNELKCKIRETNSLPSYANLIFFFKKQICFMSTRRHVCVCAYVQLSEVICGGENSVWDLWS